MLIVQGRRNVKISVGSNLVYVYVRFKYSNRVKKHIWKKISHFLERKFLLICLCGLLRISELYFAYLSPSIDWNTNYLYTLNYPINEKPQNPSCSFIDFSKYFLRTCSLTWFFPFFCFSSMSIALLTLLHLTFWNICVSILSKLIFPSL